MKKTTEIAKIMNKEEFGGALVKAAQDKMREKLSTAIVAEVESIIRLIDISDARAEVEKSRVKILRRRLAAVEAGKVTFQEAPGTGGARITYDEKELNKSLPQYRDSSLDDEYRHPGEGFNIKPNDV